MSECVAQRLGVAVIGKATGSTKTELKGKAEKTAGKVQKEAGNLREKMK